MPKITGTWITGKLVGTWVTNIHRNITMFVILVVLVLQLPDPPVSVFYR